MFKMYIVHMQTMWIASRGMRTDSEEPGLIVGKEAIFRPVGLFTFKNSAKQYFEEEIRDNQIAEQEFVKELAEEGIEQEVQDLGYIDWHWSTNTKTEIYGEITGNHHGNVFCYELREVPVLE